MTSRSDVVPSASTAYVDVNIPMYAGSREHAYRAPSLRVMALIGERPRAFVCSAECFQEILYRYLRARTWERGREVFDAFGELMRDRVVPVLFEGIELASRLADSAGAADARALLHAAVMRRLGVTRIISTDRGFDAVEGVTRLDPGHIEEWFAALE